MNLTNADTYVLEEVTRQRMELVDRLITEDAARGEVRDNYLDLHHFLCVDCKRNARALDLHVGFTQAIIPCPWCWMPSSEINRAPTKAQEDTHRHMEFYRPLTDEEISIYHEAIVEEGIRAALWIPSADHEDPDDEIRIKTQNASATRLLNGLLLPRNLVDRKEGDMRR